MTRSLRVLSFVVGAPAAVTAVVLLVSPAEAETVLPNDQPTGLRAGTKAAKVEVDTALTPEHQGGIRARASVFVGAPTDDVRDAVLDLQARAEEGWMVDAVTVYRDEGDDDSIHRRARWELSILGIDITYHCLYDWDRKSSEIRWSLDPSRNNDLDLAEGVYELEPADGGTKLTYTVEVGSKHEAAKPIKRAVTSRSVRNLLESVRTRAEASAPVI